MIGGIIAVSCIAACGSTPDLAANTAPAHQLDPPTQVSTSMEGDQSRLRVVGARDLGPIDQGERILGRDGGYSVPFRGSFVWIFGDTFSRPRDGGQTIAQSSSWAVSADPDDFNPEVPSLEEPTLDGGGVPRILALTPDEEDDNATHSSPDCIEPACAWWTLWPSAVVADPERDRLLVTYSKLRQWDDPFGFQAVGSSIAVWKDLDAPAERPALGVEPEEPTLMRVDHDDVAFGSAAVVEGPLLYLLQCGDPLATAASHKGCMLARAPLARALERDAWSYLGRDRQWAENRDDAIPLFEGNSVMSVGYSEYLGGYIATYSVPFSNDVAMRFARSLTGPWSEPIAAFTAETPSELWVYDAMAHPELQRDGGRLQYVTYSHRTASNASELQLVEVELGH